MIEFERISTYQDVLFVYNLQMSKPILDEQFNTFEKFDLYFNRKLRGYFHDFFIVINNGDRIGIAMAYDFRVYDSHCKFEIILSRECDIYIDVINEFTEYLFKKYPLSRVFTVQTDGNIIGLYIECGFIQEALVKEYIYLNGIYCDVAILALDRREKESVL